MKKALFLILVSALVAGASFAAGQQAASASGPVKIQLWTQEGESEGAFQYVKKLADAFVAANPQVAIEVVQKDTEALREDFQTASLAGSAPELLWTVSDHAGPFTAADLIRPVDDIVKTKDFVESVVMNGKTWAVPISSGNHLMLQYNKKFVPVPPKNTDEMIKMAKDLMASGKVQYGLVYNQVEPFWLAPWLGGFGGKVFAADGVTPTLNTPEMVKTLQFMADLKAVHKIVPVECDYNAADTLFKEGKAAMIINGDWSLGDYSKILGANHGVAPIPQVKGAKWPAPYTSGKYFMIAKDVDAAQLAAIKAFIAYVTSYENQVGMVVELKRLPGLKKALEDQAITSDPILKGSSEQMAKGTPMPTVIEMRANWDAMKPEQNKVLAGSETPAAAAKNMQAAAEAGVKALK
jgi:arabinogalactan oligomer / maltooligosaccharide transport system substrate-binding protein